MSNLQSAIEKAANDFAREILAAVKSSSLQELLAIHEVAAAVPGVRRGRPPKAAAKKTTKKAVRAPAKKKRQIAWPKCKHRGCKKNAWRRGNGFCGAHFKASK
jgi:hypothetical protein